MPFLAMSMVVAEFLQLNVIYYSASEFTVVPILLTHKRLILHNNTREFPTGLYSAVKVTCVRLIKMASLLHYQPSIKCATFFLSTQTIGPIVDRYCL